MGGGKGGADFDPKGKSDNEIRKFCAAFMKELSRHIGANTDVPAGDIGVSPREIGWMFGTYRQARNAWEGVLTGKGLSWGGSLIRPEATGYGLVYVSIVPIFTPVDRKETQKRFVLGPWLMGQPLLQYVEHMIKYASEGKESFKGKKVAISGSGNVAQYAALKVIELGGTVVSLSDSKGAFISEEGISEKLVEEVAALKVARKSLSDISDQKGHKVKYVEGARPWVHVGSVDVALPCATQNEVSGEEAEALVKAGCKFIAEGSNMGCTQDAIEHFETTRKEKKAEGIWYGPGKAANAGGVAVSGLEMAQNSSRVAWTSEEVDDKLKGIMKNCFDNCLETAKEYVAPKEGELPSLVAGANIAGFRKVAAAMKDQGDWW